MEDVRQGTGLRVEGKTDRPDGASVGAMGRGVVLLTDLPEDLMRLIGIKGRPVAVHVP